MKPLRLVGVIFAALLLTGVVFAEPPGQQPVGDDFDVPGGHFYSQARGSAPAGSGFLVLDDAAGGFWTAFRAQGGVEGLGYPISHRYRWNGALSQAFQKGILSVADNRVVRANLMDEFSRAGHDTALASFQQVPPPFDWRGDARRTFAETVDAHQAILRINPPTQLFYGNVPSPLDRWGLPVSAADYADSYVVRTQKAVIQLWRVARPFAAPGQIVIASMGEVARDYALIAPGALQPTVGGVPPAVVDWTTGASVAPNAPGTLPGIVPTVLVPYLTPGLIPGFPPLPSVTPVVGQQAAPGAPLPTATAGQPIVPAFPSFPPSVVPPAGGGAVPTFFPTVPTGQPAGGTPPPIIPTGVPTGIPTGLPTGIPTGIPTSIGTIPPAVTTTATPTRTNTPATIPTITPTGTVGQPTRSPTAYSGPR